MWNLILETYNTAVNYICVWINSCQLLYIHNYVILSILIFLFISYLWWLYHFPVSFCETGNQINLNLRGEMFADNVQRRIIHLLMCIERDYLSSYLLNFKRYDPMLQNMDITVNILIHEHIPLDRDLRKKYFLYYLLRSD